MNYLSGLQASNYSLSSPSYSSGTGVQMPSGGMLDTSNIPSYAGVNTGIVNYGAKSGAGTIVTGISEAISSIFGFLTANKNQESASLYNSMRPEASPPKSSTPLVLGLGAIATIGAVYLVSK